MIYLCIPAHDEEQTVGVVLWKIRQVLTDFPRDYQILVADDASTDGTAEVLAPYARVLPLTILRARQRRGYAASLEMLLREACRRSPYPRRDVIVVLQADFTDEPEDIVPLIKKIEQGADIVGGTRATNTRPALIERWLTRWQRRLLHRLAWPEDAGDPLSGFRSYRVYTIARAIDNAGTERLLHWDGAIADAELLQAAAAHARRVESIDLVHRPDRRQRPTRASTWETLGRLRRFVRGAKPLTTVPLAQLSPETLPPPRPLEIERERRSEAAVPDRGRNGRGGRNGRNERGSEARATRGGETRAARGGTQRTG
ncbi:MAG: glycosyltransferase family 2 protein, partial [Longimicrobiales bacterium]